MHILKLDAILNAVISRDIISFIRQFLGLINPFTAKICPGGKCVDICNVL